MVTIGKNILENITTGMYQDSKVVYREYIQNACDQIDKAIGSGILTEEDAYVDIDIDIEKRYISIKDNATGVKESEFQSNIGDIANSNKEQGKDKGFRGIGRLCGLAYCKTLKFTATALGEAVASRITYDAEKMRKILRNNKKQSVDEVLTEIMKFETIQEDEEEHYFLVELFEINKENTELLNTGKVTDYLSFVAPVPYRREFLLCDQIYNHAKKIDYHIDEYNIFINGAQVHKEYTSRLKEQSGNNLKNYDEISKLEFKNLYNASGALIAWMWIGLSRFEKSIPKLNSMRGIRARQANIQIGKEDVFQHLFKESRGNNYFVGEVYTVSENLIANSQRDYFNETETRVVFEDVLRCYFYDTLHKLYTEANKIKNAYKRQDELVKISQEFQKKNEANSFIDNQAREKLAQQVVAAKDDAEKAMKQLEKYDNLEDTSPIAEVKKQISVKFNAPTLVSKAQQVAIEQRDETDKPSLKKPAGYAVDTLSKLNKNERKLVSKIWSIITNNAEKEVAEILIEKIKEEFR